MNAPYIPDAAILGKARRLAARTFAKRPLEIALETPLVSFSFDDFPKSAAIEGARIVEARGWRATYYASACFAGGATHHGEMFDMGDLMRLDAAGHEIGCHSYAHADASKLQPDAVLADCERNRRCLALMGLETRLETFAFPYGEAVPRAKTRLIERYRALRGVAPGINRGRADRALLKAVALDGGEAGLARALAAIEDAAAAPGWLIFYGHDVRRNPSEWGCTPEFLETVCGAVERCGARVDTVAGALKLIERGQA